MSPSGGSGGGTRMTPSPDYLRASLPPPFFIVAAALAVAGVWFFSQRVEMLDAWGLFWSGALAGAAVTWWIVRGR